MAGTPHKAAGPTVAKADETGSADLTADEQEAIRASDALDSATVAKSDLTGKRVRAIPAVITKATGHATTVEIRRSDFKKVGISHATVQWDFRRDNFTVKVGEKSGEISPEAAKYLTENHSNSFEFLDEG